jgi:hypothetical protein
MSVVFRARRIAVFVAQRCEHIRQPTVGALHLLALSFALEAP